MIFRSPFTAHGRGDGSPPWAPAPGELKSISYPAGYFGTNGGATLGEIDPIYQTWHPLYGSGNSYSLPYGIPASASWSSINAYCGKAFNSTTRDYLGFGAGHSAINVSAPYSFSLPELRWKWLDSALPFDGYTATAGESWPLTAETANPYYTNGEIDFEWGEIQGGSSSWGALARPGIIQPIPGHSRSLNFCIPANKAGNASGKFFKFNGPTGKTGGVTGSTNSHLFDFGTKTWARAANYYNGPQNGTGCAYDPVTNKGVTFGAGGTFSSTFGVFDVPTELWSVRNSTNTKQTGTDHGGNCLHEASRLYIIPAARTVADASASPGNGVKYTFFAAPFDDIVGAGSFSLATLTVSVSTTWPLLATGYNDYLGWSYCPLDECLYCTAPINGTNKYWKLTPPAGAVSTNDYLTGTWTLTEHAFSSGSWVQSLTYLNQFNRNQWDAASQAFIWHSGGLADPVMAWRPA